MKKNIINFLLLTTILFVGCKKEDKRYPFSIDLKRVPYVNVTLDATGSQTIDLVNLANFNGKYNINLLYPADVAPSKVDIVIRKNNDNTNVKIVQAGLTTFPSGTLTLTAAQIATLFGTAVKLGDNYDIGVDIYAQDGTKYEAFPLGTGVTAYGGTGQANQPGFTPTIRFSAICAYDPNLYQGNFVVVSDAWADFIPGDIIVLTKVSNTQFSFTHFAAANPTPFVVTVNANNTITAARQQVGTSWLYSANPATYPLATMSATGSVAPCDKTATLDIQYGVNGTASGAVFGGGPYRLIIRKQ